MTHNPPRRALPITRGIAAQLRYLRDARGWAAADVGALMREQGFDEWGRQAVTNVETLRRRIVGADELLGLSYVLGIAPLHLLVPVDEPEFRITPAHDPVSADVARAWICGDDASLSRDQRWYWRHRPVAYPKTGTAAARAVAGGRKVVEHADGGR
jgi:transcriptional regulator with XRE-family HTH domain